MDANMMTTLADNTLDLLRTVSTATLSTQLFKRGFRNVFIQGVSRLTKAPQGNLVGPAYTVRNIPAREDLDELAAFRNPDHPQRKSIEMIPEGHVMVVDCRRETRVASGGEILTTRLMKRGAAGFVSDGPVRDSAGIADLPFQVFCAGASAPLNLILHHAVDVNVPIGCGGVAVYPDDIIVGDDDGVVVIPRHLADQVASDAVEQEHLEVFILEQIRNGAKLPGTYPPSPEVEEAYRAWRLTRPS
jgi:regulator of RNase E activity RraA